MDPKMITLKTPGGVVNLDLLAPPQQIDDVLIVQVAADYRAYPCGCSAAPAESVPGYCPEHGVCCLCGESANPAHETDGDDYCDNCIETNSQPE